MTEASRMNIPYRQLVKGLVAALVGTLIVAAVLSYLYPVVIGGADLSPYVKSSLLGDSDVWGLVVAVFLVACAVTVATFVIFALCAIAVRRRVLPSLEGANVVKVVLIGASASAVALSALWFVQHQFGLLTTGDLFFARLVIAIDGPLAMLLFRSASKRDQCRENASAHSRK